MVALFVLQASGSFCFYVHIGEPTVQHLLVSIDLIVAQLLKTVRYKPLNNRAKTFSGTVGYVVKE